MNTLIKSSGPGTMVQLSSKVTFRWVWNTCKIHLECVQDASETSSEHTQDVSVQAQNLVIELQQNLCDCHALFYQTQDTSRTRARRVWHTCEDYLGVCAILSNSIHSCLLFDKFELQNDTTTSCLVSNTILKKTRSL